MQYKDFTTIILGIQDVTIKNLHDFGNIIQFDLETKKHLQVCPCCKKYTNKVHDYRTQKIQHTNLVDERIVYLSLKKRRYVCKHCGKRFYEEYKFIEKYFRKSNYLYEKIILDLKQLNNIKTVARNNHVSAPTVQRFMNYEIFLRGLHNITKLPPHIGIDEFKGNCNGTKYQFHIFNLDTHKTVDIVESRSYDALEQYFSKIENTKEITIVSMDLYNPFKRVVKDKLPNATIIADRFHYTRIVLQALDELRLNFWRKAQKYEKKYFKHLKHALSKSRNNASEKDKEKLLYAFELSPILREAYLLKEEFLNIKDLNNYDIKEKTFREWLYKAESSTIPGFENMVKTLRSWHAYISNSFKMNYSNGPTEGKNNLIKVIKRNAFGYRNLNNFRNRILLIDLAA